MILSSGKRFVYKLPNFVNIAKTSMYTLAKLVVKEVHAIESGPSDDTMQQTIKVEGPKIFAPESVHGDYLKEFKEKLLHEKQMNYPSTVTGEITLGGVTRMYKVFEVTDENSNL